MSEISLRIEKVVDGGHGLGFKDQKAVFVPFVLPGELVVVQIEEERAHFAMASLLAVLEPSEARGEPGCPLFGTCGGCQWLHASYDMQMEMKKAILTENLVRLARLEVSGVTIIPAEQQWAYRSSARLHVNPEGLPGYYKQGTHDVVPQAGCPLHDPFIDPIVKASQGVIGAQTMTIKVGDEGDTVASLISPSLRDPSEQMMALPAGGLFFNHRHVRGAQWVIRKAGGVSFRVSPYSFFQVHRQMAEKLHQEAKRMISQSDRVTLVDLYSGVGAIGMGMTDTFSDVIGIEVEKSSVVVAREACHRNKITNYKQMETSCLSGMMSIEKKGIKPSAIIVDPPRRGCEQDLLDRICKANPSILVYVSCNPATMARDLAYLCKKGWKLDEILLLDLFPQTFHIESVVCLKMS